MTTTFVAQARPVEREQLDIGGRIDVSLGTGGSRVLAQAISRSRSYRAWANFEFIAHDGSVNDVDWLAFSPEGLAIAHREIRVIQDNRTTHEEIAR